LLKSDGDKVSKAEELISHGDNISSKELLLQVIKNTPDKYEYKYIRDGNLYIECWDQTEFIHVVNWYTNTLGKDTKIFWIQNVYPKAYYLIAQIYLEEKNYKKAFQALKLGYKLQSSHPRYHLIAGKIYSKMNNHETALEYYNKINIDDLFVSDTIRAIALRSIGYEHIELQDFGSAELVFLESLKYDSNNEVALNELQYIKENAKNDKVINNELNTYKKQKMEPLGGWLAVVSIGLVLHSIYTFFHLIDLVEYAKKIDWSFLWGREFLVILSVILELGIQIYMLIFSVILIFLFYQRTKIFPRLFIVYLSILLTLGLLQVIAATAPIFPSYVSDGASVFLFRVFIISLISVPYFLKSKRVKKTFIARINQS